MVNVNVVIPIVLFVIMVMALPTALNFWVNSRTRGKHLCAILEKGRPMGFKLLKIVKDDFVRDKDDEWILKQDLMKPVAFPMMWPKILQGFQKDVWCSLLMRGRSDPLNWENPPAGALSSKEVPVILDPHWLINLVKGVGEEGKSPKSDKMLLYLAVGAGVLSLLVLFYVITRLGGIDQSINALKALIR